MSRYFDFIYEDRRFAALCEMRIEFRASGLDPESLDAPKFVPAGSTESRPEFHLSSFTFRHGG